MVISTTQSSRTLEREAGRNVELMWLTDRLVPDHKTIAEGHAAMGKEAKAVLEVERLEVVADHGDFDSEETLACDQAGEGSGPIAGLQIPIAKPRASLSLKATMSANRSRPASPGACEPRLHSHSGRCYTTKTQS
jgi:hypothetical protein